VGQVIPWNFPLLMLAWKLAPALAAGNTVVLKPAETTSITCLKFAEILQEADLPPGVVNFVAGAGETGAAVVAHPAAAKVAFTGSTEVGKAILRSLAGTDKKLTLELGGKAANIIFDDAPLDQAVEGIVNGIFFNQGHVCCAGSRPLVHEPVAELVLAKLRRRIAVLRVGDPMDKNTDIGAINSRAQLKRIESLVASGVREGASLYQPACPLPAKGFYFRPSVFSGVTMSHRVAREEIFGPVLSVLTFRTVDEAVEKANNTAYGLSAVCGPRRARVFLSSARSSRRAWFGRTHTTSLIRRRRLAVTRRAGLAARVAGRGCWITSRWVEPRMDTDEHGSGLREEALTHAIIGAAFEVLNGLGQKSLTKTRSWWNWSCGA
jgi:aldehyde dehydrogenase (NAD+)